MAYTWTNGELITAEKLNQTGGGGGLTMVAHVSCANSTNQSVSVGQDSDVILNKYSDFDTFETIETLPDYDFAVVEAITTRGKVTLTGFDFYNGNSPRLNVKNDTSSAVSLRSDDIALDALLYKLS